MLKVVQNKLSSLFGKNAPLLQKDTLYFEMLEALRKDQCPVCFLAEKYEQKYIEALFYESVNDGLTRKKLEHSQGLCAYHTQRFTEIGDALGLSILGVDLLENWLATFEENSTSPCVLCENQKENDKRLTQAFVQFLSFEEFWEELKTSNGLCKKHFLQVLPRINEKSLKRDFIKWEKGKVKQISDYLYEVIRKHDYRFQNEKISANEAQSIRSVWKLLQK